MSLPTAQKKQIENLVKEGNLISDIRRQHFPKQTYGEIYSVAHEKTDGGSMGIKRKITNRLNDLVKTDAKDKKNLLAKEIRDLVNSLYKQHKDMSAKISEIREVLP